MIRAIKKISTKDRRNLLIRNLSKMEKILKGKKS